MLKNINISRCLGVVMLIVLVSGCASQPKLRSAYDDSVDFSQYKTYNFYSNAGPEAAGYQGLFTQYMITAIKIEMQNRGYTLSDAPDLMVNFNANLQDKTKVTTSPSMYGGSSYYGYRGSRYGGWGGYGYGTDTHVSQYTEGTFNIDLVDPKRKQLVWEAVTVGKIDDDAFQNIQQRVKAGVPRAFALYPFKAGDATAYESK